MIPWSRLGQSKSTNNPIGPIRSIYLCIWELWLYRSSQLCTHTQELPLKQSDQNLSFYWVPDCTIRSDCIIFFDQFEIFLCFLSYLIISLDLIFNILRLGREYFCKHYFFHWSAWLYSPIFPNHSGNLFSIREIWLAWYIRLPYSL